MAEAKVQELPVVWLPCAACTGCSVSVLNSVSPTIKNVLVDEVIPGKHVSLKVHPTVMAGAGDQVEKELDSLEPGYVLVVEGAIPTKDDGVYGEFAGKTMIERLTTLAKDAVAILALGTCASYGGIPAGDPNPTGCKSVSEVLKEAKTRGVGVVAMKTLAGAKDMELDPKGAVFEHAAFKWVLSHPEVAGLVVTMKRVRDIDLYLQASGQALTEADRRTLDRYAALYGNDYCRTGCSDCEGRCPVGVPIASILRYQMYFEQYQVEKQAMQSYAALGRNALACLGCSVESCVGGCPNGLPVSLKLRAAHDALSFRG